MSIYDKVLAFIHQPEPVRFTQLALELFQFQFERIEPYREYCRSRGASPQTVRSVAEIPPVSTTAFKYAALASAPPERIFLTSGTSRGRERRGRHIVPNLELYRASATRHLARMLFADGCRPSMLALHPTADVMPASSLSQMLTWCIESFGGARSLCAATAQRVDLDSACDFLRDTQRGGEPVCVLATTAALGALFAHLQGRGLRFELPAGSRLMDTGGAKGQVMPLEPAQVIALAGHYLAIAPELAINEYGMTELCSQLYDATHFNFPGVQSAEERIKVAPPWLAVMALDPVTMRPLRPGETGLLSFFDLANAGSVSAIVTEDLGTVIGEGAIRIYGRAYGSDARGCALGVEQFGARPEGGEQKLPATGSVAGDGVRLEHAQRLDQASLQPYQINSPAGQAEGTRAGGDCEVAAGVSPALQIEQAASRLRDESLSRPAAQQVAIALAKACELWRQGDYVHRRVTLASSAAASGQSEALLSASLDALLAAFTADALLGLAGNLGTQDRLIGFVMPGNVIGAGLHELVQALIAGTAVIVKSASAQPLFFAEFRRALAAIDPALARRIAVLNWDRSDREATTALARACDRLVAFGDDGTMAALTAIAGKRIIDFGPRTSAALLSSEAAFGPDADRIAAALALDATLCDQRGCLSLCHLFIEDASTRRACSFAQLLAGEMENLAQRMPPPIAPALSDTVAARVALENTRWRAIGAPIDLWEGKDLRWSVIFDPGAEFQAGPFCRTVTVSTFADHDEFRARLSGANGRLEGFAIADPAGRLEALRATLRELGVSYFCAPGLLQSPPPSWAHGGGRFLKLMGWPDE